MKRTTAVISLSTIVMIGSILGIANGVAFHFAGTIDTYLNKETTNYDTEKVNNAVSKGKELAKDVTRSGSVLLKNQNQCLPLDVKTNRKVNVFGWGGSDDGFLYQGGGSSEGGYSGDKISLYDGLEQAGLEVNRTLGNAYHALGYRREGAPDQDQWSTYYRLYEPGTNFYTEERMKQATDFSDTAIMVFSRRATEGDDLPKCQYNESGVEDDSRPYLCLSDKEALMINRVTQNFKNVIVLFNGSASMEMGFLDYNGIDAAIQIGYPGYYGTVGVGDILTGATDPSGKLVDTAAYDITTAPSYVNTGNLESHLYQGRGFRYTDYAEDIYVGYRWYETAAKEGFYDSSYLNSYGHEKKGYDAIVQYPFGYGLSYTNFDWTIKSAKLGDKDIIGGMDKETRNNLTPSDVINYEVWVENKGKTAGREVVELYYEAPYTKGGIEKSSINLIDFQKTGLLKPGEGETLKLSVRLSDMASYDTYDKNNNGFMGYELEKGDYNLSFRTDVHTEKTIADPSNSTKQIPATFTYNLSKDYQIDKDPDTGAEVKNHFTTYENKTSKASSKIDEPQATYAVSIDGKDASSDYDQGITYLSREDFSKTFPKTGATRSVNQTFVDNVFKVHAPTINSEDVMPVTDDISPNLTLDDLKGVPYDDPRWQKLVSELSVDELALLSADGGFGTIEISKIKKPLCHDSDGGTGFTDGVSTGSEGHAVKYPAANVLSQTWDWKAAYQWGCSVGEEGQALNKQGWYAPGCNIHRSPLGGRNFEYFSEDGRLAGIFVAYSVKGATEHGVYCYTKHFAGNDSDAGRNGQFKWMTEQSLREVYAKPMELATKIGKANATMISVDRIGSVRATGSYALLTDLLRKEWGFQGSAITDYYQGGNVNDMDEGIRAGCDLGLNPNGKRSTFDDTSSATSVIALQNAAHNILFTYIDTVYRTETSTGIDLSSNIGTATTETKKTGSWWRPTLISLDCVVGAGLVCWAVLSILFTFVLPKKKQ